ncbi:hypothetical protein NE865_11923 [Phthorimaea operculella]|nr:hypothetical protein NE865_11923 [Phthorimaea operculella]
MTRYEEFHSLLRKLQCTNRFAQCTALKDITTALQEGNKSDLAELLELLISTHDTEIQIKLFSVLAAYIINNGANYELIVKYNPLYDTIQTMLVRGLPMKTAVVLNFVMALVTGDETDARSLATHARNMMRISGCLNTMAVMFSGSMMYQDTWIALCQSLAEVCRNSEINQNYSSHLVPLCVQRCRQGNIDVCAVLQSLLQNHERNIQLFIDSNGDNIFTRQLLQYSMGMQLLNTIVEKSAAAVSLLRTTDVVLHLRNFLRLYGPYSQLGQWATIILYHLDKGETSMLEASNRPQLQNVTTEQLNKNLLQKESLNQQLEEVQGVADKPFDQRSKVNHININTTHRIDDKNHTATQDDTASLFSNVIKEVLYWKSQENNKLNKQNVIDNIFSKNFACDRAVGNAQRAPVVQNTQNIYRSTTKPKQNIRPNMPEKDLTFSFLMNETKQEPRKQYRNLNTENLIESFLTSTPHFSKQYRNPNSDKLIESFMTPSNTYSRNNVSSYDKGVKTNILGNTQFYDDKSDLRNFRPPFISTPKRNKTFRKNVFKATHKSRASITYSRKSITRAIRPQRTDNSQLEKTQSVNREVKQCSMSARLFSAINDSCTTIVKSMKSIFRSKQDKDKANNDVTMGANENETENASCSYSFTNYMRKRDALLEGEFSHHDSSSSGNYKVDSCKTCRDTIVLQQKMKRDDHLKQTVRKLKMGINLYGCDFKKISHAMWPHDRYMTPEMLYNLYRKLIVKGGHENHSFRFREKANYDLRKR